MTIFAPCPRLSAQRGTTAVEFALTAMVFMTFIFGLIELSRAMYLWNTMAEVTHRAARAAAITDFTDSAAMDMVRRKALFRSTAGGLPMGGDITDAHLTVSHLRSNLAPVSPMPTCPAQNIINCAADPDGASCIRFVQVRLCVPGGAGCTRVPYTSMLALDSLFSGSFHFPTFATVTPAGSLGYRPGATNVCP
ncbi:MAG: TadE family protein [Telluria sp.]|nr:pilus assembly protein [Telluria sp.]